MMERKRLDGTDLVLAPIAYGTALFGSSLKGADLDTCIRLYRDAGGNFFDTANCYAFWLPEGPGSSERALGDYLRRNGKDDLIIGTKGGHPGVPGYRFYDHWLSPESLATDIDESLSRLGLDTLDLFWLHRDDPRVPAGDVIETLNAEIRRGRIRYLGASNWRIARIAAANAYAAQHGLQGFVANQPQWNLAQRKVPNPPPGKEDVYTLLFLEEADEAWHRESRLPVAAYSATAGGFFATAGAKAAETYGHPTSRARLERAAILAKEMGCLPGQIAIAWLLNQAWTVIPIIGPCRPDHLRDDLGAADLRLTRDQLDWLRNG